MRGFVGLATLMVTGCLGASGIFGPAQGAVAPKQTDKAAAKSAVLTSSPTCPNISTDAVNHQTATEPIIVQYDGKAKGALRSTRSLTLHVALPRMSQLGTVQHFPMTRQPDGMWLATVTLTGSAVNSGYVMFDVEDQDHHIDRNGGQYWDSQLCYTNRNAPANKFPAPTSLAIKLQSYDGRMMAPGFQRAPDTARALALVREHFTKYPQNFGDLFSIWSYETKGGAGRGSDADWAQVSRELDDAVAKYGATSGFFMGILGFVAPNQGQIDPAVMARLRAAIIASPQTIQPVRWQPDGSLRPIPRSKQWDDAVAKEVTFMLSELDLPMAEHIADPATRGAGLEAYTNKYADCGDLCFELAPAYRYGIQSYVDAGDLEGARRMAEEWSAWDPKNPDPPATLAKTYLNADKRLREALELTNRAAELYQPYVKTMTRSSNDHSIRSQVYFAVAPYATENGRIELLRGKIESAMGDWAAAAKDLQVASDELAQNENMVVEGMDAALALGQAREHMGDKDAALSAYLRAASGPYRKDPGPHDNYVRLFVANGNGTEQQAEDSLLLALKEHRAKEKNNYVPVELHQPLPKLQLIEINGKAISLDKRRRLLVVDLWATWCEACALELPSLLAFQRSHPEVDVLAVDVADSPEAVTQFLTSKRLTGLHVALTKAFPEGMPQNYPTTFVVSQKHEIAFLHESVPNDIGAELGVDLAALNPH
jgi:thiol-disulfide isomerase/thioredoxin